MMINVGNGKFIRPDEVASTDIRNDDQHGGLVLEAVLKSGERIGFASSLKLDEESLADLSKVAHAFALMCGNVCKLGGVE